MLNAKVYEAESMMISPGTRMVPLCDWSEKRRQRPTAFIAVVQAHTSAGHPTALALQPAYRKIDGWYSFLT
ncbi:MAG: hypothetical protein NCW75_12640 [Phycisphaera sp.]|nr:MAG: hypothetical protein NCW75_12640 [Phycisphaera sp.]